MRFGIILLSLAAIFASDLGASQAQAGHPVRTSRGSWWYQPARLYWRPDISRYPGLGSNVASPYSVVTHSGLYKTGPHGGYYGPRNGGPIPQQ